MPDADSVQPKARRQGQRNALGIAPRARPQGRDKVMLKKQFLVELRRTGTVGMAAEALDVSTNALYKWRDEDPEWAASWAEMTERTHDVMEQSLFDMAQQKNGMASFHSARLWLQTHRKKWREQPAEGATEVLARTLESFVMALRESRAAGRAALGSGDSLDAQD